MGKVAYGGKRVNKKVEPLEIQERHRRWLLSVLVILVVDDGMEIGNYQTGNL